MPKKSLPKKDHLPPRTKKGHPALKKSPPRKSAYPAPQEIPQRYTLLILLILILLPALTFWPVLGHEFLNWDDNKNITRNSQIKALTPQNLKAIFLDSAKISNYYIPLTFVTFSLDHAVFGLNARAFHRTNLILHIANGLLVFWFFCLLTRRPSLAFFIAALFSVHPMQVEAVSWITERKGLLAAFFLLLSLLSYLRFSVPSPLPSPPQMGARGRWRSYAVSIGFFILSLLSKPTGLPLPFLLLLLDYYYGRRWTRRVFYEKIPFLALSMIFGFISLMGQEAGGAMGSREIMGLSNLLWAPYSILFYLGIFFVPVNLSAFYPYPDNVPLVSIFLALALTGAVISFRKKREFFFGAGFFLLAILPVIKIVPFGNHIAADRLMYVPSIGLFFLIGWLCQRLCSAPAKIARFKMPAFFLMAAGIVGIFVWLSRDRLPVWHDSGTLWEDVLKHHSKVALAHGNLGAFYGEKNRLDEAVVQLQKALALQPNYAKAHYNLAVAYLRKNEMSLAMQHFERALALGHKLSPEILKEMERGK